LPLSCNDTAADETHYAVRRTGTRFHNGDEKMARLEGAPFFETIRVIMGSFFPGDRLDRAVVDGFLDLVLACAF
jgi:hypothetical protein